MLYDVTIPIRPGMPGWPGDGDVRCEISGEDAVVSRWTLNSHTGTHLDAPAHLGYTGTVDAIDPATLLGPCRVLDLGEVPRVTADVLARHDPRGVTRLLLRTRNSRARRTDPDVFDPAYVALDDGAARWLLDHGMRLLGIDGFSVDRYGALDAHRLLLGAGLVILEGLQLDGVPAGAYDLICAPLPLAGADGAPARVWLSTATGNTPG